MKPSRNAPCPCGSGKKYKKCCLTQDEKAAAVRREQQRQEFETAQAQQAAVLQEMDELNDLSNKANDLILAGQWDEAEACCRQLKERFPDQVDGDHRFYEMYQACGDLAKARTHAQAALQIVERSPDGFDPEFPAMLREDIATFDERLGSA